MRGKVKGYTWWVAGDAGGRNGVQDQEIFVSSFSGRFLCFHVSSLLTAHLDYLKVGLGRGIINVFSLG